MEPSLPTASPRSGGSPGLAPRGRARGAGDDRVWLDVSGSLLGLDSELDPLSTDVLSRALGHFSRAALRYGGHLPPERGLVGVFDRQVHINVSALLGLLRPGALAEWVAEVDPRAARGLLRNSVVPTDDLRERQLLPGMLMRGARALAAVVAGQLQPAWSRGVVDEAWNDWEARIDRRALRPLDEGGFGRWLDRLLMPTARLVVDELIPRIALATTAARAVREPFSERPECVGLLDSLTIALDGSSVCQMVLDLVDEPTSLGDRFGHRGPSELSVLPEVGRPAGGRPARTVQWRRLLRQSPGLRGEWDRAVQARRLAVTTLAADLPGPLERARFLAAAEVVAELGGLSDAPLAALSRVLVPVRARLQEILGAAVQQGRLHPSELARLSVDGVDALLRGDEVDFLDLPALPGSRLGTAPLDRPLGVVRGCATGLSITPERALAEAPALGDRVLVADLLAPWMAPMVAASAGVVIAGQAGFGPSVAVARSFRRPCVMVGSRLPAGGLLRVDGDRPDVAALD